MSRERLIPALVLATVLGMGSLVLQRWVAETRDAAIVMVAIWFAIVGGAALVYTSSRPELRTPVLGMFALVLGGTVAIGYLTGFKDNEVNEDVVMANERVADEERDSALAGASADTSERPEGPVELAKGMFEGVDGHTASGSATVVRTADGARTVTFTGFEVDPGPGVVVWLTRDESNLDDRIELGGLKGNVGDQAYEIPGDADLTNYDTVVLYCTPFTVRIAVAPLS